MSPLHRRWDDLNRRIIACRRCPDLIQYIEEVGRKKVRRFRQWDYWARPVPNFGDPAGRLAIIGLAPGAHGANRTGRMFTGDDSGRWLYRALYEAGFANQPTWERADDGLQLIDCFITAAIHCAPPKNKPAARHLAACRPFLEETLQIAADVRVYLCLGRIAFDSLRKVMALPRLEFGHLKVHRLDSGKYVVASYHPSRQNTQTGRLTWAQWTAVFGVCRRLVAESGPMPR